MKMIKDFFEKIKKVKHFEIYLAVFIGLIVCVCYFAFFVDKTTDDTITENSTQEYSSTQEYVDNLENKLSNVLSKISGVGEVSVLITLESGFSYEYAFDTETITSGTNETTTQMLVIIDGEPVVVKEIYPVIKGVVIVAEGSENFSIKMNILDAVTTILGIDESDITILS